MRRPRRYSTPLAEAVVKAALKMARNADVDGVIAVGGGSSMDVAKVVAVLVNSEQSLQEIYGVDQVTGHRLPLILVPTTAGTGSEVTAASVLNDTERGAKFSILSNYLRPIAAVVDPMRSTAPQILAALGL